MTASTLNQPLAGSRRPAAADMAVELSFVLAPRQNLFFAELVEALSFEAQSLGVATSVHYGSFPKPHPGIVYVVVPPHEYFTLTHGQHGPSAETLRRTIFICAEQPDTSFFEDNLRLAPKAGAVFDINRRAVSAFGSHGIEAHHLQLGWTEPWDHLRERERDIDVLFMGCASKRRERALGTYARVLSRRRTCLVLSDNSRPNWTPSESFRVEEDKWDLLGRSKVLINVHQGDSPYFEWLRIVQAMANGAVVVSEHSLDHDPLLAGRHFLSGEVSSLGLLAELLLEDGHRWWQMQTEAYHAVREDLPLRAGAEQLIATACELARNEPEPPVGDPCFAAHQPASASLRIFSEPASPPALSDGDHNASVVRRAAKHLKLDLIDVRRRLSRIELALSQGHMPPPIEVAAQTPGYGAARPVISVLTALYNHQEYVQDALDSLAASLDNSWELIVVDDGSSDASQEAALRWMKSHGEAAALLLAHPVNRGLAHARNSALGWARGHYCFVLDADNEIYPVCLGRLRQALEDDAQAAFAYGMFERFSRSGASGMLNTMPWEPRRLRMGNFVDAMAMIRTGILRRFGGYTRDPRLHGWEDFDLWCGLAEAGLRGRLVPEFVARYRTTDHSMLALTNVSVTDAFSVIIERHPELMGGLRPPD